MSANISIDEIHLLKIDLADEILYETYLPLLSPEEIVRADRFVFPYLKKYFVVARGALREALAQALHCLPREIVFAYQPHGKPYLTNSNLAFNLSHSAEVGLIAIGLNNQIGIDVEKIKSKFELGIAKKYFSADEFNALMAAMPDEQITLFHRIWSRKEAFIKCTGLGVHHELKGFSVPVDENVLQQCMHVNGEDWFISNVEVGATFSAALVTNFLVKKIIKNF